MNKDHKTQVAILLRGQLGHAELGGLLYKRTVQDRFWDVGFRICAGVPNTVSSTMSTIQDEVVYPRETTQSRLPQPIDHYLSSWGPKHVRQVRTRELMECCHQLYNIAIHKYTGLGDHWAHTQHRHLMFPLGGDGIARAMANDMIDNVILDDNNMDKTSGADAFLNSVKLELLKFHYVLGQIWSMGEAYNSYKELISQNPDWKPDVIWCTRPDAFGWYPDNVWHNLKHSVRNMPGIHCTNTSIANGRPYIADYNFYSSPNEIEHYGNICNKLIDAWENHPGLLASLLDSGSNLQHQLWSLVFKDTCMVSMHPPLRPIYQGVLRPIEGLESAVHTAVGDSYLDTSKDSIRDLHNFINSDYNYPTPNTPPSPQLISDTWNDIISD